MTSLRQLAACHTINYLSKLSAYGLCADSVELLKSYLSGRKQQIKLNSIVSSWSEVKKGDPRDLFLDLLFFNVFINDIYIFFIFLKHGTLYNYADDNTLSFSTPDFNELRCVLKSESLTLMNWFHIICMQAIAVGKENI